MKIGAVIAEYNPFHNGHAYQLAEFRRACALDFCIVIMSGNFVQRGEPAICSKRERAYWALQGGADLVIELPVYYAAANAMAFARGAVATLSGIADVLGFGAETSDTELLEQAAHIDVTKVDGLRSGKAYPRALAEWVCENHGAQIAQIYSNPNTTLAMEYIKARDALAPQMQIHVTKRQGAEHDSDKTDGSFASASKLRSLLFENKSIADFVPDFVRPKHIISLKDFDRLILYRLRHISYDELENVADVSEGLHNLIIREAMRCISYEDLLLRIKSKRYTMARLKRICMSALLNITNSMIYSPPEYIHVLGIREAARKPLLSEIKKRSPLPILLGGKDYKIYSVFSPVLLNIDINATDTYSLFYDELPNSDYSNKLLIF